MRLESVIFWAPERSRCETVSSLSSMRHTGANEAFGVLLCKVKVVLKYIVYVICKFCDWLTANMISNIKVLLVESVFVKLMQRRVLRIMAHAAPLMPNGVSRVCVAPRKETPRRHVPSEAGRSPVDCGRLLPP